MLYDLWFVCRSCKASSAKWRQDGSRFGGTFPPNGHLQATWQPLRLAPCIQYPPIGGKSLTLVWLWSFFDLKSMLCFTRLFKQRSEESIFLMRAWLIAKYTALLLHMLHTYMADKLKGCLWCMLKYFLKLSAAAEFGLQDLLTCAPVSNPKHHFSISNPEHHNLGSHAPRRAWACLSTGAGPCEEERRETTEVATNARISFHGTHSTGPCCSNVTGKSLNTVN